MNNITGVPSNLTNNTLCSVAVNTRAAAITKVSIYSVIAIASLLGNSLLVLVFIRTKAMRKTVDVFVINMAVSDLFIPVFLIPRLIVTEITVERFVAVAFPLKVRQISSKLRFYAIIMVWIIAMGIHAPYFYAFRLADSGDCDSNWEPAFNHELTHVGYETAIFVVVVILPFTLITILYSAIIWVLLLKKDKLSSHRSCKKRKKEDHRQLRVLKMAAAIVSSFALCWAPFNVQQFLILFAPEKIPECSLAYSIYSEAALVLAVAYCIVNPAVCLIWMSNYRSNECSSISHGLQQNSLSRHATSFKRDFFP
ncbi:hypothetical protein OS493_008224 [Desmophyllum pertusum]|uniref:G-protein coupled receptors family 1 profile domain-containing protein n=1 Tax=Desmophyllum pertusum TaxID=174260 RepID=A0A9X0A7J1_9CNID|nr:hypothetical protein OS493_008224 [Desmophyllum pertusum]